MVFTVLLPPTVGKLGSLEANVRQQHKKAKRLFGFLLAYGVVSVMSAGLAVTVLLEEELHDVVSLSIPELVRLEELVSRGEMIYAVGWAVSIATGLLFLVWIYQAYLNLLVWKAEGLKYSERQAVWAFFVPFLNLFRPYQIMCEIWSGSEFHGTRTEEESRPFIEFWWAFWIVGLFSARWLPGNTGYSVEVLSSDIQWSIFASGFNVILVCLTYQVVRRIDQLQMARLSPTMRESS